MSRGRPRARCWPYGDTPTVVVTHCKLAAERPNIECYSGDLGRLVNERLRPRFNKVWVVGGAAVVRDFLQAGLADEIRMPILPILLGDGLRFFERVEREQGLHLKDVTAYKNGMVDLWYEIKKSPDKNPGFC